MFQTRFERSKELFEKKYGRPLYGGPIETLLVPCPVCGGLPVKELKHTEPFVGVYGKEEIMYLWRVSCSCPECSTKTKYYEDEFNAFDAWNVAAKKAKYENRRN